MRDAGDRAEGDRVKRRRAVRLWLYVLAGLVVAMVAVGGATRLTGSGLSITEWRPVTGVVPPLSAAGWEAEFAKYRETPQYEILNRGMGLADFKVLYGWEWGHRLLGRLLGLALLLPLVAFWWRGLLDRRLVAGLVALGVLGGLQGAIGWIMVASGLKPGMTAVEPVKLMLHLVTASALFAGLVWLAAGLDRRLEGPVPPRLRATAGLLAALVFLQIGLGGLVAGAKAGLTYNTWPLMDGALSPPLAGLLAVVPWYENLVDNVALVQFDHRLGAYLLLAVALFHALDAARTAPGSGAARRARALAGLVVVQATLGITTLLLVVPLWAALLHQVFATLVLGMAVVQVRLLAGARRARRGEVRASLPDGALARPAA